MLAECQCQFLPYEQSRVNANLCRCSITLCEPGSCLSASRVSSTQMAGLLMKENASKTYLKSKKNHPSLLHGSLQTLTSKCFLRENSARGARTRGKERRKEGGRASSRWHVSKVSKNTRLLAGSRGMCLGGCVKPQDVRTVRQHGVGCWLGRWTWGKVAIYLLTNVSH